MNYTPVCMPGTQMSGIPWELFDYVTKKYPGVQITAELMEKCEKEMESRKDEQSGSIRRVKA